MNVRSIIDGLQGALQTVQKLAPVAQALGLPAVITNVANIGNAAVEVAENVLKRIDDGHVVASHEDTAQVRSILAELQSENDALAAKIANP